MSVQYEDLAPEERAIVNAFRKLNQARQRAVLASENAFFEWLRTSVTWVWQKITGYAREFWNWFKSIFW